MKTACAATLAKPNAARRTYAACRGDAGNVIPSSLDMRTARAFPTNAPKGA
ncbi:hypothetical protein MBT84_18310 [Streptomyces sp. MBT84]|nr:hypothetical protein [Streptomyces sp. MBT84]